LQLAPGQNFPLNLHAFDELGHNVYAIAFASEDDNVRGNSTSKLQLQNVLYALPSNSSNSVPFSFQVSEALYNKTCHRKDKVDRRNIQFVDFFSALQNGYSFEVELQPCLPGFLYSVDSKTCICNKELAGIMR